MAHTSTHPIRRQEPITPKICSRGHACTLLHTFGASARVLRRAGDLFSSSTVRARITSMLLGCLQHGPAIRTHKSSFISRSFA